MTSSLTSHNVTAIIPAYNESTQIGCILDVLRYTPEINQIILVDDGSTDSTLSTMQQAAQIDPRIQIIHHQTNRGKGEAVFSGHQATQGRYSLLLDADLYDLQPCHIRELMQPVFGDQADLTIGIFTGGRWNTDLSHFVTPWLSGQRFLHTHLLDQINWKAASGYGLETTLTVTARRKGWRRRYIPWHGVYHPPSEYHRGLWGGSYNRARMYAQIVRAWLRS